MTPNELIVMLTEKMGPCGRFCAYCPEDINTGEVKACVEEMQRKIYNIQQVNDDLLKELIKIRRAYKDVTGNEYRDNSER